MAGGTSLAYGNPAVGTVDRAPQTGQPRAGNAPFVRKSRFATSLQFDLTGQGFGATITPQMKAVGGYIRNYLLEIIGTAGSGTSVTGAADAPYNYISLMTLRDASGAPIINLDGYGLYLVNLFGNQFASGGMQDPAKFDPFSAIASGTGNFTAVEAIPFELDTAGYCALPSLSSAALPQLQIITSALATVYSTTPGTTSPSIELRAFANFWGAPVDDPALGPPDVGSSAQWNFVQAPTTWAKSSNTRIPLPVQLTYIHTLILALRDTGASNARVDQYPTTDLTFWVDQVPVHFESLNVAKIRMIRAFAVNATLNTGRPTGVVAYTWRDSADGTADAADTHDYYLYTTPATLIEIGGTSGSGGTGPFAVFAYAGRLHPKGGIPYTHLAA